MRFLISVFIIGCGSVQPQGDEPGADRLVPLEDGQAPPLSGYGVGGGPYDNDYRWFYNWGYPTDAALMNQVEHTEMVWGGPPGDGCWHPWDPEEDAIYGHSACLGCANYGADGCFPGGVPTAETQAYVDDIVARATARPGKNWLMFNEPDLGEPTASSFLDPVFAAELYDYLVQEIRAADPLARFYVGGVAPNICTTTDEPVHGESSFNCRDWLAIFARHVTADAYGVHMHNYVANDAPDLDVASPRARNFRAAPIIDGMISFSNTLQTLTDANGNRIFQGKPIIVSEWATLDAEVQGTDTYRCEGAYNQRDGTMRGVAQWFDTTGTTYGYVAAAWYVSSTFNNTGNGRSYDLVYSDGTNTCLGDEFASYHWACNEVCETDLDCQYGDECTQQAWLWNHRGTLETFLEGVPLTGEVHSFNVFYHPPSDQIRQTVVVGDEVYKRTSVDWLWGLEGTVDEVFPGSGPVVSYDIFFHEPSGETRQNLIRGDRLWYRSSIDWTVWQDRGLVADAFAGTGTAEILAFDIFVRPNGETRQHLLRADRVYQRRSSNWGVWLDRGTLDEFLEGTEPGDVWGFDVLLHPTGEIRQHALRGSHAWQRRDTSVRRCRSGEERRTEDCAPLPR